MFIKIQEQFELIIGVTKISIKIMSVGFLHQIAFVRQSIGKNVEKTHTSEEKTSRNELKL